LDSLPGSLVFTKSSRLRNERPSPIAQEQTIDVHIESLRRKLGDAGEHIETVRGVGYRFSNAVSARDL
jgi:DNA-binding response OmpR family regulator